MVKAVQCKLCGEYLRANGKIALRGEIQTHFINNHPEKLSEWNALNQEVLSNIIRERQRLMEKASTIVSVPELLVNEM